VCDRVAREKSPKRNRSTPTTDASGDPHPARDTIDERDEDGVDSLGVLRERPSAHCEPIEPTPTDTTGRGSRL
jgi:hypothetical protein